MLHLPVPYCGGHHTADSLPNRHRGQQHNIFRAGNYQLAVGAIGRGGMLPIQYPHLPVLNR